MPTIDSSDWKSNDTETDPYYELVVNKIINSPNDGINCVPFAWLCNGANLYEYTSVQNYKIRTTPFIWDYVRTDDNPSNFNIKTNYKGSLQIRFICIN